MDDNFQKLGNVAAGVVAGVVAFKVGDRASWLKRREADVTASVAAALFGDGVHPYMTAYELFAIKSGLITEDKAESPAMRRGRLLEPVAVHLLREERPNWRIEPGSHYFRDERARIGATPDAFAWRPDIEGRGIVQIKTVGTFAFKKGWRGEDGEVEIPLWIAVQASIEAALTGATWASVAAMALGDGGLDLYVVDIPLKPALMIRLRALVAVFWRRVAENDPYPADYNRDAALIARLYADADEGGEIDLAGDNRAVELLEAREALKAREADGTAAAKDRKIIDAEIIAKLGNAARGRLGDGRVIEAKTTRRGAYQVEATSYRTVRIKDEHQRKAGRNAGGNRAQQSAGLADGPF